MNANPRLPRLDDTSNWQEVFVERFYRLWSEHAQDHSTFEPQYGSWTPVLTFATPGDLAVAYSSGGGGVQIGSFTRQGKLVHADFTVMTSSFTFTTASGAAKITGLPFLAVNETNQVFVGKPIWQGITFSVAGYSEVFMQMIANTSELKLAISGSGKTAVDLTTADMPTGGSVLVRGSIIYRCQ